MSMGIPEAERRLDLFGTSVRILVGEHGEESPALAALTTEIQLRRLHERLTRFDPASELSSLNADPRSAVPVSDTLAAFVRCAIQAYALSDGLVDSVVVVDALEAAGYEHSWSGTRRASLADALAVAPERCPARPRIESPMAGVRLEPVSGLVVRPPGVRLDSGGVGKGLAADLTAARLAEHSTYVVDVGGDLRIGGARPSPRTVKIEHPFGDGSAAELKLARGGVATSSLANRIWLTERGYAHHLIDPSTGQPAWTGVVAASALAPTAAGAEILAKAALLSGADRGREILDRFGGVLIRDDGSVELVGELVTAPSDDRAKSPGPLPASEPAPEYAAPISPKTRVAA